MLSCVVVATMEELAVVELAVLLILLLSGYFKSVMTQLSIVAGTVTIRISDYYASLSLLNSTLTLK